MKTLYLLRHAHTEPAAPPLMSDHERILSPKGIRDAEKLAQFMKQENIFPDFVISSSAVRTLQTARTVFGKLLKEEGLKIETHFARELYQAPADALLEKIRATSDDVSALLVVAHNPGIADLAQFLSRNTLADHTLDYKPCTMTWLTADINNWRDVSPVTSKIKTVFTAS